MARALSYWNVLSLWCKLFNIFKFVYLYTIFILQLKLSNLCASNFSPITSLHKLNQHIFKIYNHHICNHLVKQAYIVPFMYIAHRHPQGKYHGGGWFSMNMIRPLISDGEVLVKKNVICSRQCPNGDGIYTLLNALYKYSTSITNQPTMLVGFITYRNFPATHQLVDMKIKGFVTKY